MAIIVKKFGGTSVGSIELIKSIAEKIAREHRKADSLVLVVSAMAKTTDGLFKLAFGISDHPSRRELDMLLTAGERISMSLLSLALQEQGFSSISFTGSQSGIITNDKHGNARILKVNAFRINQELEKGRIVIVAGFQGVSEAKEITTLGRGGSDTSAVALACYLKAQHCEIYTDVDGVYTADPRIVPSARLVPKIDYDQMLALSYNGSRVMHPRAVEFALKYQIRVEVKSSFTFAPGTLITNVPPNKESPMEGCEITAIAHKENLLRYVLKTDQNLLDAFKVWIYEIFRYNAENGKLELLIEEKYASEVDYYLNLQQVKILKRETGWGSITLVGYGINLDPIYLGAVISECEQFQIKRIQHSDRTIELLLPSAEVQACVQKLHRAFVEGV